MIKVQSYLENPILEPNPKNEWESLAAFNGSVIKVEKKYYLVYRAMSPSGSTIGIAESTDKHNFGKRRQLIAPDKPWEIGGCEDPRITKIDDQFLIFYTTITDKVPNVNTIKVAVALSDDLVTIKEKHLVTPFNAKAMALFPRRINGKLVAILTVDTDKPPAKIAIATFDEIEEIWSESYWRDWYRNLKQHTIDISRMTSDQIEVGAVPVETEKGWILIYAHIQNYFKADKTIFGIEALLLDHQNVKKIVGRTEEPLMVPQESYELEGMVPNIVFPSGVLLENTRLYIYYGAADTSCALASCNVDDLLNELLKKNGNLVPKLKRLHNNPLLESRSYLAWEQRSIFNPAAVFDGEKINIVYRAMSLDNTSVLGLAISKDGETIDERLEKPIYVPRMDFEIKKVPGGNSGCEDPRISQIGERFYMCYTAYNGVDPPRIALTSILTSDFVNHRWNWKMPVLISDPGVDNKDAGILPEKIDDKFIMFHREGGKGIVIDVIDSLEFESNEWLKGDLCIPTREGWWDSEKIGISSPPIRTNKGWLLLYHGMSKYDNHYRVGAMLLDLKDPLIILGRSKYPILEPEVDYEKIGDVANVVFPCGAVVIKDMLYVYYGGADKVVAGAKIDLNELVISLTT